MESNSNTSNSSAVPAKFKLKVHPTKFSEESLVLNQKDFPGIREDDIVKIYNCESTKDESSYLVIKVSSLKKGGDLQKSVPPGTISIEQMMANRFGLRSYQSVYVTKVLPSDVSLYMLEVTFKDQYISRSDMWRLKKDLVGSCTYLDEKVEFSDVRAQVNELWINSKKVKSGLITNDTRIVLRSASALVYIFIQMSREMWDFDAYGQLQFERAINGFLKDLFIKWRDKCYHEFTLVLFSRSFYKVTDISEFSAEVQDLVLIDYKGRFYIDFYKCVTYNERCEDCTPLLFTLKKLFNQYKKMIEIPGCPPGYNSSSSEGNFLEAVNMSLNYFEKHYIDRNFDRTGQLVMCITPGVGVFDVSRDLTVLTKERMIDNGIGSDLVCLGKQPLHAVPLFKFHSKEKQDANFEAGVSPSYDFNIPHWINHSFYTSNPFPDAGTTGIKYVPRIHLASSKTAEVATERHSKEICEKNYFVKYASFMEMDYEEFDREIFSSRSLTRILGKNPHKFTPKRSTSNEFRRQKSRVRTISDDWKQTTSPDNKARAMQSNPLHIPQHRTPDIFRVKAAAQHASSLEPARNSDQFARKKDVCNSFKRELVVGSAHSHHFVPKTSKEVRRALINPFVASYTLTPLTSNRRRWVHTYPRGPQGEVIINHYHNTRVSRNNLSVSRRISESSDLSIENSPHVANRYASTYSNSYSKKASHSLPGSVNSSEMSNNSSEQLQDSPKSYIITDGASQFMAGFPSSPDRHHSMPITRFGLGWLWGVSGDIPWTSDLTVGVDWKSLRCPACLPITNDYFPSQTRLQNEYVEHSYSLIPDHDDEQYREKPPDNLLEYNCEQGIWWRMQSQQSVSTREFFLELVNQRLCQGFQLVVTEHSEGRRHYDSATSFSDLFSPSCGDTSFLSVTSTSPVYSQSSLLVDNSETYTLNHGRQYHIVNLIGENEIDVKIFRPKHQFHTAEIDYKYFLWPVKSKGYQMARIKFAHEQYESYYWNYVDNYVCSQGDDTDFRLHDKMKYWRSKFIVIPSPTSKLRIQKSESEDAQKEGRPVRYDLFTKEESDLSSNSPGDNTQQILCSFVRFLEHVNKIKRQHASAAQSTRKPTKALSMTKSTVSSLPSSGAISGGNSHVSTGTLTPPPGSNSSASRSSTPVTRHSSPPRIAISEAKCIEFRPIPIHPAQSSEAHMKVTNFTVENSEADLPVAKRNLKPLSQDSDLIEIIEAILDKRYGFSFLPHQKGLRGNCFFSIEGVQWCMKNIPGLQKIDEACILFQKICDSRYICHASGDFSHPFIYGSYIYCVTAEKNQEPEMSDPTSHQYESYATVNAKSFSAYWLELELQVNKDKKDPNAEQFVVRTKPKSALSSLLEKTCSPRSESSNTSAFHTELKTVLLSMHNKHKTARTEWYQLQYPSIVKSWCGSIIFGFEIQWMVATATCLYEMLQNWTREATRCNLFMLPVSSNLLAASHYEKNTSPLHCPLFVPVTLNSIFQMKDQGLLENQCEWRKRILQFMEAIAIKFGFLKFYDHCRASGKEKMSPRGKSHKLCRRYVHHTGQFFLEIPLNSEMKIEGYSLGEKHRNAVATEITKQTSLSPNERHKDGFVIQSEELGKTVETSGQAERTKAVADSEIASVGYYIIWNQMLTKRWRISALEDCPVADLERDFVAFCRNEDNRLVDFYCDCY